MLPKPDRLRRMKDFALLSQRGRVVYAPFYALRFRETRDRTRVGFVASTKVFKTAVSRNRVKRRMREVLRAVREVWPTKLDLLFILKWEAKEAPFEELIVSVKRSFEKIPEAMTRPPKPKIPKARKKTSVVYKNDGV